VIRYRSSSRSRVMELAEHLLDVKISFELPNDLVVAPVDIELSIYFTS
jgi:hypothetical protein